MDYRVTITSAVHMDTAEVGQEMYDAHLAVTRGYVERAWAKVAPKMAVSVTQKGRGKKKILVHTFVMCNKASEGDAKSGALYWFDRMCTAANSRNTSTGTKDIVAIPCD